MSTIVRSEPNLIARGSGRAYGDSAINPSATVETRHLNRMIRFDPSSGQLVAEAGVQLGDIISAFLPHGWFPLVTPGTRFVSLGGAIAADVHGKNHHNDGSFRNCVDWIDLMRQDGTIKRCSLDEDAELFDYTLGGMGLTGVIVRAAIRLRPVETAWIRQTTISTDNLANCMQVIEGAQNATYSVAWIDCLGQAANLGRALVMLGEHAEVSDLPLDMKAAPLQIKPKKMRSVPVYLPALTLNRYSLSAFNSLYYWIGSRKRGDRIVDWKSYFYPLDSIAGWNKIYGRKGFVQFQCVLPLESSESGLTALLAEIASAGTGSFLSVLKRFGKQSGAFSFPMEGYTLALDFPVNAKVFALLDRLDRITIEHGGRFYLAKDSRMRSETLHASDERIGDFQTMRESREFTAHFRSAQSERLEL
ncbi:FAD-binding oxidoreductase [Roseovarius faecimaris]|uniref:FAD-binding oxidoreductase n=1 Tax=Roseovarius faecimaris TaxID=2494550 RepID=UPI001FE97D64|nr:FAD-binding oxidoreductase [Roseovarius faecimaris]